MNTRTDKGSSDSNARFTANVPRQEAEKTLLRDQAERQRLYVEGFAAEAFATHMDALAAVRGRIMHISGMLGGRMTLGDIDFAGPIEVHDLLSHGLPASAVKHFLSVLSVVEEPELAKAMGVSVRTMQRIKKKDSTERLSTDQSSNAWQFAEVLALATEVFGTREQAEVWLKSPATGLDQRRPIDLLSTSAGAEAVKTFLTRLDLGVYA